MEIHTKMCLVLFMDEESYDALSREKGKPQISMYYRIPVLPKLPAPSQKATCTHILCEQERRKVTLQHVLSVGSTDEKGMGRDADFFLLTSSYGVEWTRVTFVNFEKKLMKSEKKKFVQHKG